MMRTKEEIGQKLTEIWEASGHIGTDAQAIGAVLMHIQEALIDIRDLLDQHLNPVGNKCVCGYSNPIKATNCGDCGAELH